MRNVIIAFAAAALLASAGPALAKSKKHNGHHGGHHKSHHVHKHHKHHGHKHHRKHRRQGWGSSFFFAFPIVQRSYQANPVYVEPVPRQRARFNCQPTTGTRYINGRMASIGGTFCYDAYGQGYVVPGSEYFIGYIQ